MSRRRTMFTCFALAAATAAVIACAPSSHVLVGKARSLITPEEVNIAHAPAGRFEEIAVLDASSKSAFGTGGQKTANKMIDRLKVELAKLGANGVILEGFSDSETGSIGAGVGSDSYGNHSAAGVGEFIKRPVTGMRFMSLPQGPDAPGREEMVMATPLVEADVDRGGAAGRGPSAVWS